MPVSKTHRVGVGAVLAIASLISSAVVSVDAAGAATVPEARVTTIVRAQCEVEPGASHFAYVNGVYNFRGTGFPADTSVLVHYVNRSQFDTPGDVDGSGSFNISSTLRGYSADPNHDFSVTNEDDTTTLFGPKELPAPVCATKLTNGRSTRVKPSGPVSLSTHLSFASGKGNVSGAVVQLLARSGPTKSYSVIRSFKTSSDGNVTYVAKPKVTTIFEWHFAGSSGFRASTSASRTVTVRR